MNMRRLLKRLKISTKAFPGSVPPQLYKKRIRDAIENFARLRVYGTKFRVRTHRKKVRRRLP